MDQQTAFPGEVIPVFRPEMQPEKERAPETGALIIS